LRITVEVRQRLEMSGGGGLKRAKPKLGCTERKRKTIIKIQ
jgi:hypothetical protein